MSTSSSKHMMLFGEFKQALLFVSGYAGMEGRPIHQLVGMQNINFLDSWAIYNDQPLAGNGHPKWVVEQ